MHASGLDQPLGLIRMDYSHDFPNPTLVVPHANWRGTYEVGTFIAANCKSVWLPSYEVEQQDSTGHRVLPLTDPDGSEYDLLQERCIRIDFPGKAMGMRHLLRQSSVAGPIAWMGSLPQDAQDASGLMYRRNRFYDPRSGRFTQEDPLGLAGGVNSYGFAEGDPVSYADPYGLYVEFAGDSPENREKAITHWNNLYRQAREARSSSDPVIREAGRRIQAMMVRMWYDTKTRYYVNVRAFSGVEVKEYGHSNEGPWRSSSPPGALAWDVSINVDAPDPVRALAHELGGAEARTHGNPDHFAPSVAAEDIYRTMRNCPLRQAHSYTWMPPCY